VLHVAAVSSAAAAACVAVATELLAFQSYDACAFGAANDVAAVGVAAAVAAAAAVAGHAADVAAAGGDAVAAAAAGGRGWAGSLPSPCLGHVCYPHTFRRSHVRKYLLPILKARDDRAFSAL